VINNLDPSFHHFRDTTTHSLKIATENCGQTAADGDMVTIDKPAGSCQRPIRWYHHRLLWLTAWLAYHSALMTF